MRDVNYKVTFTHRGFIVAVYYVYADSPAEAEERAGFSVPDSYDNCRVEVV